jgi:hypothetical protein
MIKSIIIYRNVENTSNLQSFYWEKVFPRTQKIPAIIFAKLTTVSQQVSEKIPSNLEGLQFMMEFYFESTKTMSRFVSSPEGQDLMGLIQEYSLDGTCYLMGMEKRFDSKAQNQITTFNVNDPNRIKVKSIGICTNIKNPYDFQEFYLREVFPIFISFPGVCSLNITKVIKSEGVTQDHREIQLIMEGSYISEEAMYNVFALPKAQKVMELIEQKAHGDFNVFLGHEEIFDFKNAKKSYHESNYSSNESTTKFIKGTL